MQVQVYTFYFLGTTGTISLFTVYNMRRVNNVISALNVTSSVECAIRCQRKHSCYAANVKNRKTCEFTMGVLIDSDVVEDSSSIVIIEGEVTFNLARGILASHYKQICNILNILLEYMFALVIISYL